MDRNFGRLSLEQRSSSKVKPALSRRDCGERTAEGEGEEEEVVWSLWSGEGWVGGGCEGEGW